MGRVRGACTAALRLFAAVVAYIALSSAGNPDTIVRRFPTGVIGECSSQLTITSNETEWAYEVKLDDGMWRLGPHFGIEKDARGKQKITGMANQPHPQRHPVVLLHELKGLVAGEHRVEVRALDSKAGWRRDPTPFQASWAIRTPTTNIISPKEGDVRVPPGGALTVTLRSDAPKYAYEFSVDGGAWKLGPTYAKLKADYSKDRYAGVGRHTLAPSTVEHKQGALREGWHEVRLRTFDVCGNVGGEEVVRWRTSWVSTVLEEVPKEGAILAPDATVIVFRGDVSPYSYEYKLDGGDWTSGGEQVALPSVVRHSFPGLVDGPHQLELRALDSRGRPDFEARTIRFAVDALPPVSTISVAGGAHEADGLTHLPGEPWGKAEGTFRWEVEDAMPNCTSEWRLDGGAWNPAGGGRVAKVGALADGPHSFEVRSMDGAGNVEAPPARHEWEVHAAAPSTVFVDTPALYSRDASPWFHVTASKPDCTLFRSLDGAEYGETDPAVRLYSLVDGRHTLRIYAVDRHGLRETAPHEYTWVVDTVPPATAVSLLEGGGAAPLPEGEVAFAVMAEDAEGAGAGAGALEIEYSINRAPWHLARTKRGPGGSLELRLSGLVEGAHHVLQVRARDRAGNTDPDPAEIVFAYPRSAPVESPAEGGLGEGGERVGGGGDAGGGGEPTGGGSAKDRESSGGGGEAPAEPPKKGIWGGLLASLGKGGAGGASGGQGRRVGRFMKKHNELRR